MSDEQPSEPSAEQAVEAPFLDAQSSEAHHGKRQPQDPRSRLRELLAIPERDRSDALWDEIIGLEIDMAPGNRISSPQGDNGRRQDPGKRQDQGRRPDQARRQDPARAKSGKRFFQKRKRGPGGPPERS
jgi:hypothetical protein